MTGVSDFERFDAAYFRRYYGRGVGHDRRRIAQLGTGVLSLASSWHVPIRSVLDVGAGKGYWRDWLTATHPRVSYHGLDASVHACRRYGHDRADIAVWRPRRQYDLVVCQSVLQYLNDSDTVRTIAMLAAACRGLLLLEVPTVADRDTVIDPAYTDLDVRFRTGRWYRKRLTQGFTEIGGGLWLSHSSTVVFFELERAR